MSAAHRDSARPASLNQRIRESERQLAGRQRSLGLRAGALRRNLRQNLGSPIALIIAAGAGFAVGQFSKRKRAEAAPRSDPPSDRPSLFATLMDALTLATTVMAMLPAMRREPARDTATAGETP